VKKGEIATLQPSLQAAGKVDLRLVRSRLHRPMLVAIGPRR